MELQVLPGKVRCERCSVGLCCLCGRGDCMHANHGFLYAIQAAGIRGPVKIGHSRNPWRRVRELQTGRVEPLALLGIGVATRAMEAMWHRRLKHAALGGEWFDSGDRAVAGLVRKMQVWTIRHRLECRDWVDTEERCDGCGEIQSLRRYNAFLYCAACFASATEAA